MNISEMKEKQNEGIKENGLALPGRGVSVIFVGCANGPQQVAGPDQEPEVKDSEAELAEANEEIPVHSWHKERVNGIGREKEWADLLLRFIEAAHADANPSLQTD
jgi:hypothetical protein